MFSKFTLPHHADCFNFNSFRLKSRKKKQTWNELNKIMTIFYAAHYPPTLVFVATPPPSPPIPNLSQSLYMKGDTMWGLRLFPINKIDDQQKNTYMSELSIAFSQKKKTGEMISEGESFWGGFSFRISLDGINFMRSIFFFVVLRHICIRANLTWV